MPIPAGIGRMAMGVRAAGGWWSRSKVVARRRPNSGYFVRASSNNTFQSPRARSLGQNGEFVGSATWALSTLLVLDSRMARGLGQRDEGIVMAGRGRRRG